MRSKATLISVCFHLAGQLHAQRDLHHVPAVGDGVILRDGSYRVADRIWNLEALNDYDEHVAHLVVVPQSEVQP